MEKKIDSCKMWIWRRMLRVAWTERRTSLSPIIILQEIWAMRGGLPLLHRAAYSVPSHSYNWTTLFLIHLRHSDNWIGQLVFILIFITDSLLYVIIKTGSIC